MHRLLAKNGASSDRRAQRTHPARKRPELLATQPNEIWSWDITKLHGPTRGLFYDLYVISTSSAATSSTGWSPRTKTRNSPKSSSKTRSSPGDHPRYAHIHADRGGPCAPAGQSVDGGPRRDEESLTAHVSNDNPFSEAAFKTLKYCPTFPPRFGCLEDARVFCEEFFTYYNHEHRHSGIGLHTPRRCTTARTWRFVNSASDVERRLRGQPDSLSSARAARTFDTELVWINPPELEVAANI